MSEYQEKTLVELYIPGTHDSSCYSVNYNPFTTLYSNLSSLYKFLGLIPCITNKFTQTQNIDIYDQLKLGVRFLDLRISYFNDIYYCSHTYLCGPLIDYLEQIKKFNVENPNEVIIVRYKADYNHRNTIINLNELHKYIVSNLGPKVNTGCDTYIKSSNGDYMNMNMKIKDIVRNGPILVFNDFETIWLNVSNFNDFEKKYNESINNKQIKLGLDCVITPNNSSNYFTESIKKYSESIKNFFINNIYKDKKLFTVYSFDYIDKQVCDYIISLNK